MGYTSRISLTTAKNGTSIPFMDKIKQKLAKSALRVLKPLVRIFIRFEVSHTEFSELAKTAYVEAAYDHFTIPNRKQTYSRVAVLTGLSRKEVVRLTKGRETQAEKTKGSINRAARVIQAWLIDEDFTDESHMPKELPLRGDHPSFESLVAKNSGDITSRAILDELIRIGAVEKLEKDFVALRQQSYIPEFNDPEKIELFTAHAGDMLETGAHNLSSDCSEPRLQQQLTYHNIPESVMQEFKQLSREKSEALLNELNLWLAEKKEHTDLRPGEKMGRAGLGIYHVEEFNKEE